jgi:sulfoxide reductase heme-binding subunit YedZ
LLSLACTPFNIVFGWSKVIQIRKPLGLFAFGFALLHGLTYVGWDYRFDFSLLLENLQYQTYILAGGTAFLILTLLALASINKVKNRLGKIWRTIQQLVYLAGGLVLVHVIWLRKTIRESVSLMVIMAVLFLIRVPWIKKGIITLRLSLFKQKRIA